MSDRNLEELLEDQLDKLNTELKNHRTNFSLVLTQTPETRLNLASESKASDAGFACEIYDYEE